MGGVTCGRTAVDRRLRVGVDFLFSVLAMVLDCGHGGLLRSGCSQQDGRIQAGVCDRIVSHRRFDRTKSGTRILAQYFGFLAYYANRDRRYHHGNTMPATVLVVSRTNEYLVAGRGELETMLALEMSRVRWREWWGLWLPARRSFLRSSEQRLWA